MKKILAALFAGLIFCSAVFAESGPKTVDEAIDKFFEGRRLDPIEGIWFSPKEQANYAIVKFDNDEYKVWTINHKLSEYEGTLDPNAIWKWRRYATGWKYNCATTVYDITDPSIQAKGSGVCQLMYGEHTIKIHWSPGCWSEGHCWRESYTEWTQVYPFNVIGEQRRIDREKNIKIGTRLLIALGFFVIFIVWLRWSRKNTLSDYNKEHKTNFKTYSDLQIFLEKKEYKKRKEEEEKEKKREVAEAKKIAIEQKKHEQQKLKEERSKAREAKVTTSEPSGSDIGARLKKLRKMYKDGILSKVEFEKAKNKLLK